MPDYDVIICGAGPAGSSLAIHLARQGRTVLLLDRSEFPREKPCGEGVMPAGVEALHRLGVGVEGTAFGGVRYHYGTRTARGRFPNAALGLGVRRSVLDAALLSTACSHANVEVRTNTRVEAPLIEGGTVAGVIADGREYRARFTVGADGANSILRHRLGWDHSVRQRRFGVRRHYRLQQIAEPWVDVYLGDECETYLTPLPGGELLVASLGATRAELPPRLRGLEPIDEPLGAYPLAVRARQRMGQGCVLLGDAAGNCDPITGGGISQALLSSELLARHLERSFPPALDTLRVFDRARQRMLAPYRSLTAGVLALATRPRLLGPALTALDQFPSLFTRLLGVAGGAA